MAASDAVGGGELRENERDGMTEKPWVRHLTASDILDLQSLMVLLIGRDKEEREAAFKGILEIMNPVVTGIRSVEAINPSVAIQDVLEDRNWSIDNFVGHLWFHTSWSGSSKVDAKALFCRLIAGTQRIDDHAASMLSFGLDGPAKYWLDIQAAYDKAKGLNQ